MKVNSYNNDNDGDCSSYGFDVDVDGGGFDMRVCWACMSAVKRSYLGTSLQDDVDNEKEMLQLQREEVAALREQLQKQVGIV